MNTVAYKMKQTQFVSHLYCKAWVNNSPTIVYLSENNYSITLTSDGHTLVICGQVSLINNSGGSLSAYRVLGDNFKVVLYLMKSGASLHDGDTLPQHIRKGEFTRVLFLCVCCSQIARFMGPTWGPYGSCRPQMGPMLAPWTLLSGLLYGMSRIYPYPLGLPHWHQVNQCRVQVPV